MYVKVPSQLSLFPANIALDNGKVHTVGSELIAHLTDLGHDQANIVSLVTDGASTMTGKHCWCWRAKEQALSFLKPLYNTSFVGDRQNKKDGCAEKTNFNSLYHFMSGLSNRIEKLCKIQKTLEKPELTVKEPHSLGWIRLKRSIYTCKLNIIAAAAELCIGHIVFSEE